MTNRTFSYVRKLGLCALLLGDFSNPKFYSETSALKAYNLEYTLDIINGTKYSIDPNEKIKITSVTNLIANKYGDSITLVGIKNALKGTVSYTAAIYNAVTSNLVDSTATSELVNAYSKSQSELLMISGHHFSGTWTFFDNKHHFLPLIKLNPNSAPQILVMRGCHTVMNPRFLEEEAENNKYMSCTAEEFINIIIGFAPNIKLLIGYETLSPFRKDYALIDIIKNLSIAEKQGLKSYGEYALATTKRMFDNTGHEKSASGDWKYNTVHHKRYGEGKRMAYYIKEPEGWKYYSLDNPNGVDVVKKRK